MALCVTSRGKARAVSLAALLALLPLAAAQTERAPQRSVTAVRHWVFAEATRIAIEVSGEFSFRSDRIHNPERVYFDILNARPNFDSRRLYSEALVGPLAQRVRVAETTPGVTRVVIELGEDVEVASSTLSNPYRLIVELRKGSAGRQAPRTEEASAGGPGGRAQESRIGPGEPVAPAPGGATIPRPAPLSSPRTEAPPKTPAGSAKSAEPEIPLPAAPGPQSQQSAAPNAPARSERPKAPSPSKSAEPERPPNTPPQPQRQAAANASARTGISSRTQEPSRTAELEVPPSKSPAAAPSAASAADAPKRSISAPKPPRPALETSPKATEAGKPGLESEPPIFQRPAPLADASIGSTALKPAQKASEPSAKTAEADIPAPDAQNQRPPRAPNPQTASARSASLPQRAVGGQPLAAAEPAPAKRTSSGESSLVRALGLKISRVVIDPGHGGHDQGTEGPHGLLEKDVVLDVAQRLGKLIENRMGAEVIYTRSDDTFVPLHERTAIANEKKADLFLSIHVNSSPSAPRVAGVETYYLNISGSQDAMDVAARENATSDKSVFELADLIQKIAKADKAEESKEFANRMQTALYAFSAKNVAGSKNRGVKSAPFAVLIGANMPSVLVEVGFLSNTREENLLKKPDYRQKMADALYRGVTRYTDSLSHFQTATAQK